MEDRLFFANKEFTGCIEVDHVAGKSMATRLFSKYPLKLIVPNKVAPSVDVVWIYALSYGGGLVSGDTVYVQVRIGSCCTAVFTTQASTKVYKSNAGLACEQLLEVHIQQKGTFAMLPDPVTCFQASKYSQVQVFHLAADANVVLVDWCTSGRRERGEVWAFNSYRSTNHLYLEGKGPLFLDSMCLECGDTTILERMQPFQVVAMLLIYGPKLRNLCLQLEELIQIRNRKALKSRPRGMPDLLVSCSTFGPKEDGLVVRIVATTTELVYAFLHHHLATLSSLIGVPPYAGK
ncbi:hypothetical protein GOP47_0002481 [Adiantum capillus-veneris]|uniref:Urease accessory protein D n=1 Tax=Adiantum capillus-veneris TaxID=13818 RepID=A0A9D4VAP6_ADICA|nr:hypothetical protein GOP47_0002481 [Adiantum capillus-veneris]